MHPMNPKLNKSLNWEYTLYFRCHHNKQEHKSNPLFKWFRPPCYYHQLSNRWKTRTLSGICPFSRCHHNVFTVVGSCFIHPPSLSMSFFTLCTASNFFFNTFFAFFQSLYFLFKHVAILRIFHQWCTMSTEGHHDCFLVYKCY